MRASSKTEVIDGRIGIVMGADWCAEHECGIHLLKTRLGLDGSNGIDGRRIWRPEQLYLKTVDGRTFLGTLCSYAHAQHRDVNRTYGLVSEWDERHFLISAPENTDEARLLEEIYRAANNGDAFLNMFGSGNPFGSGGLAIGLIDRVPQEHKDKLLESDQAADRLQAMWSPVKKHLDRLLENPVLHPLHLKYSSRYEHQRGRLSYFYLGPDKLEDQPVEGSAYPFKLWLNPQEQSIYNSGWYTVEEIEQWARGEGPVIEGSRYHRLEQAAADPSAEIPDYYGICECGELLQFGNGPAEEVRLVGDYDSKAMEKCPKCGCPSRRFRMSECMHKQLKEHV